MDWVKQDDLFDAARPPADLKSILDREVVHPVLESVFRSGELRCSDTTIIERDGRWSDEDADYGPIIKLPVETSEGDRATFTIWQPDVEQFSTLSGIRENLLRQLEDWLPETRLHWGEEIHLLPHPGNSMS